MGNCVSPKKCNMKDENLMINNITNLNKYIDKLNEKNKEVDIIYSKKLGKIELDNDSDYNNIDNIEEMEYINICEKYKEIINRQLTLVDEFNNTSLIYKNIINN